ncbi:MAG: uracil-DNA glycosylase [Rickettsiales bacterium]
MQKSNQKIEDIIQMHVDSGVDETINSYAGEKKSADEDKTASKINVEKETKSIFMSPNDVADHAREIVDSISDLQSLKQAVESFDGCSICKTATHTVFSDGIEDSDVMLIGEAPGANEDLKGIPFCGDSGKLLDKVIKSIGLSRAKNAYITNTVFWRPPGNRRPTDNELKICRPFVEKHIAIFNPKVIILVGSTASQALFGDLGPVSKQRLQIFEYSNQYTNKKIPCVVTFHPSFLLRQPSQKRAAWQDMLFVQKVLEK